MDAADQICADYVEAFRALKGIEATASFDGKRFTITNNQGMTHGYTRRDMLGLIRILKKLAART